MRQFSASIPIGIGDLLYVKAMIEPIKDQFSSINLDMYYDIIAAYKKDPAHYQFIGELASLLFSEQPYNINTGRAPFQTLPQICDNYGITPQKPELAHLLCSGKSLHLDSPYIVINTKVRYLAREELDRTVSEFWAMLNQLSDKYKIVILGEKVIEMNPEYEIHNATATYIYSIYLNIMQNIPSDRIIDLSIPALGITSPNLQQLCQDCLIMKEAQFVIQFGVGGSFCLATSVANTVGYRVDSDYIADRVFDRIYSNAVVTKDWNLFISTLKGYL